LQGQLQFSADDIPRGVCRSEEELQKRYARIADRFVSARARALQNTRYYLSMVSDLDVYVATSMRSRNDFREMATSCEKIFDASRLKGLNLRYFDPTIERRRWP